METIEREKCEFLMGGLVHEIRYNFTKREGLILMPEQSCVDMRSAIEFFKRIDPEVTAIISFNNGFVDMTYDYDGEAWIAIHSDGRVRG